MTSIFTLNSYARGADLDESNLLWNGDFEQVDTSYAFPSVDYDGSATAVGQYPNVWVSPDNTTGTVSITTTGVNSGLYCLRLSCTSGQTAAARSPVVEVTPGETYLFRFKAKKQEAQTARLYSRLASGTTTDLNENPGWSTATALIADSGVVENDDLTFSYANIGHVATIPTGHNYAAIRASNFQPTGTSNIYLDDFEVYQLTGDDAWYGDTNWVRVLFQNSWANYASGTYGRAAVRRVGTQVEMAGLVINGTGTTITTLPPGFRPGRSRIFASTKYDNLYARVTVGTDGNVAAPDYSTTWTSIAVPLWSID
jgi:hypothetical protein